jgi:hypothetical protein
MSVYRKNSIGSLSLNGLKGSPFYERFLYLLFKFRDYNYPHNLIAVNLAIIKTKFVVFILNKMPFVKIFRDKIKRRI